MKTYTKLDCKNWQNLLERYVKGRDDHIEGEISKGKRDKLLRKRNLKGRKNGINV